MKILIVGSTGLVGSHVLQLALKNEIITHIVAPVRSSAHVVHPKLESPIIDYENLPQEASWWNVDAVICTLGTTIKKAKSKDAFYRVDHDYPLLVARTAKKHGVPTFVLNSAMGANAKSSLFYNQVKGKLEDALIDVNFNSLILVRPGLIGGDRNEKRLGEDVAKVLFTLCAPLLPKKYQINPAHAIAQKMIEVTLEQKAGQQIISADELVG